MGGQVAVEKENVLIRAGACVVTILPHLGGKIASIRVAGRELLQAPLAPYAPRTQTMSFDAGDASGWDECLPSVAPCTVKLEDGTEAEIPDHGDLWRVAWSDVTTGGQTTWDAVFAAGSLSLPFLLERAMKLVEIEGGWRLELLYELSNTSQISLPWSWAAHPLFAVEAGDRIVLPNSIETLRLEGSGSGRLGKSGDSVRWPLAQLASGGKTDLSVVQGADSGIGDKLFAGPLQAEENWCALERPGAGLRIKVSFDAAENPYLGLWLCYGGWPERPEADNPGKKQMCVALEPATAPVDSLAVTGPWSRTLKPGESATWTMTVKIESMPSVN